jgi:hypothetical protein
MRNQDADEFFESFLIAAVAAILGIRGFLHLAGYPKVGGDALHIAPMLWGGLGMLVALGLLLGFLGKPAKSAAAVIGGAGWGTFIDELGKFLTHDNDYFFQPTFALIYVTFVLMYVAWERVHERRLTREEALANALELMLEAVRKDMDAEERQRALDLLAQCDPDDPVAQSVAAGLAQVELVPPGRPGAMYRVRQFARNSYRWLVERRWFVPALIGFFVLHALNTILQSVLVVRELTASLLLFGFGVLLASILLRPGASGPLARHGVAAAAVVLSAALLAGAVVAHRLLPMLGFLEWAELVSSVVPSLFVLVGIVRLRRSRLDAYRTFKTAVLVMIFVTQFFAFYHQQLLALIGLTGNILVWLTLRGMIQQEERLRAAAAGAAVAAGAVVVRPSASGGRPSAPGARRQDVSGRRPPS